MPNLRTLLTALALLLLVACPSGAQLLRVTPDVMAFGRVPLDTTHSIDVSVMYLGDSSLTIDTALFLGGGFRVDSLRFPVLLDSGRRAASFRVSFTPRDTIAQSGKLMLIYTTSRSAVDSSGLASGQGIARFVVEPPDTLRFDQVATGMPHERSIFVTNNLRYPVEMNAAILSASGLFAIIPSKVSQLIEAGMRVEVPVTFRQDAIGEWLDSVGLSIEGDSMRTVYLLARTQSLQLSTGSGFRFGSISPGAIQQISDTVRSEQGVITVDGIRLADGHPSFTLWVARDTTGRGEFDYRQLPGAADIFPMTLRPGWRLVVRVDYQPRVAGDTLCASDRVIITSSAGEYMLPVEGCLLASLIELPSQSIDFGDVDADTCSERQVQITNEGNAPLLVDRSMIHPSGSPFTLIDSAGNPSEILVLVIAPGETRSLRIRFCPPSGGVYDAVDSISHTAINDHLIAVRLNGRGVAFHAWEAPAPVDFGRRAIGVPFDTTVRIINRSAEPVRLDGIALDPAAAARGVSIVRTRPAVGATMQPFDVLEVDLRFTPIDASPVRGMLVIEPGRRGGISVPIDGSGVEIAAEELLVSAVATSGTVGEALPVVLRLAPDLDARRARRSARVSLSYNPHSFFPLASPGWTILSRTRGDVTFERTDQTTITGSLLGTILLRPLSTARPLDSVRITSVEIAGEKVVVATPLVTVALEGCDIGRDLGLARSLRVRSIVASTSHGSATIEYRAPAGAAPRVRVIDINGTALGAVDLPAGTDEDQRYELDLRSYPPGLLILEITAGGERQAHLFRR